MQDVVDAVRLLRRSVLAAEDKINDIQSDLANQKKVNKETFQRFGNGVIH